MKKRGNVSTLAPDVEAEMERLWCDTAVHQDEIARRINERFGTAFTGQKIEWHARRRSWLRQTISKSFNNRSIREERLFRRAWERWAYRPREDNAVCRVAPGTHSARGFRLGDRRDG